jgi:serine protease inhibitor
MNFINLPRGRRLVPVPAASIKADNINACYHPDMDVTAAELPYESGEFSLILILPGKQAEFIAGGLGKLEHKLNLDNWNSLMRSFQPLKVDLQLPLFNHRSTVELKESLEAMGVSDAFRRGKADFSGVNGGRDLYLSSFKQLTEVVVDGGGGGGVLEELENRKKRDLWQMFFGAAKKRRNSRQQYVDSEGEDEREHHLHFNRQFLYVVRHNPTGMVLYIGRYYQPEGASGVGGGGDGGGSGGHHGHHAGVGEHHGHH